MIHAEENQYGPFLLALCQELAEETKPVNVRQLAGLHIKNLITSKNSTLADQKTNRWSLCETPTVTGPAVAAQGTKEQARQCFVKALASPSREVGRVAAQIIAAYGAVDVPQGQWISLMDTLFQNVTDVNVPEVVKVASLEALGFMCEAMDPDSGVPAEVVNKILMTIVDGMQATRPTSMRQAATTALCNSLSFTRANFAVDQERNVLVQAICEATQCPDEKARKAAYECIIKVAELYYDYLAPYAQTLFGLTTAAIRTDTEEVAIPAVEFWATVSEVERERLDDIDDGVQNTVILNLIAQAAPHLVACMLEMMTKQPETIDEDDWNVSEAASSCLECIAVTLRQEVVAFVLPFVQQNIGSAEWALRDAAVSAFGLILSHTDHAQMKSMIDGAIPFVLQLTADPHPRVRWSAIWTLAKICESFKDATDPLIESIVNVFLTALQDPQPLTVGKSCFGIVCLALACDGGDEQDTNVLSAFYYRLMENLLEVAKRPDHDQGSYRVSAYEAINALVENSAKDVYKTNQLILQEALTRLEATYTDHSLDAKDKLSMQGSICSLISTVLKKLEGRDVPAEPLGDRIMHQLLQILTDPAKGIAGNEDAAYAVGAVADLLNQDFVRYADFLKPVLLRGLAAEDASTCIISVGLLGDLCRALGKNVAVSAGVHNPANCDEYVAALIQLCTLDTIDRSVKPHVISFFADMAMAIEGDFERYASTVLPILKAAGDVSVTEDHDEETVEYINSLRSSILESYTGILQVRFPSIPSTSSLFSLVSSSSPHPSPHPSPSPSPAYLRA